MEPELSRACELFIQNRDAAKAALKMGSAYYYPLCAAILTERGVAPGEERLRECRALLKSRAGFFSSFRGQAEFSLIAMLAAEPLPESRLEAIFRAYDCLREDFHSSAYLPIVAAGIAEMAQPADFGAVAARTRRIYDLMKAEHPFLTSSEDSAFCALLALSPASDERLISEAEDCYRLLKESFHGSNAVQSLSHVLALSDGSANVKCRRAADLHEALRGRGLRYGTSYELPTLGVLALLGANTSQLVEELAQADEFLRAQKGFGAFGVGGRQRLMYAGILVSCRYIDHSAASRLSTAAISGAISMVIAQQAAICAAAAASAAASASASS